MRTRILIVAMAALAAMVMSGCFALRGFKWERAYVVQGNKVMANLTLRPAPSELGEQKDYPFVLVGLQERDDEPGVSDLSVGLYRKFDTGTNFGQKPKNLIKDAALRDLLLQDDQCAENGWSTTQATGMVWTALRLENPINDRGDPLKTATTRIAIKAANDAEATVQEAVFISGAWLDVGNPGDGVPASGEVRCTGSMYTTIPVNSAG